MKFSIKRCGVLVIKRGKLEESREKTLPDDQPMTQIGKKKVYIKCLRVFVADNMKHTEMKDIARKEYFKWVRITLKSKLNAGNTRFVLNSRAVSVMRHGVGIIFWKKDELEEIDRSNF